jgi:hypothetical protein
MKLLTGVALETLRMFPAAPSVSRQCAKARARGRGGGRAGPARCQLKRGPTLVGTSPHSTAPNARPQLPPHGSAPNKHPPPERAPRPAPPLPAPPRPDRPRPAPQDVTLSGHAIPAGTRVVLSLYGMQRHEGFWPRPDEWARVLGRRVGGARGLGAEFGCSAHRALCWVGLLAAATPCTPLHALRCPFPRNLPIAALPTPGPPPNTPRGAGGCRSAGCLPTPPPWRRTPTKHSCGQRPIPVVHFGQGMGAAAVLLCHPQHCRQARAAPV